MPSKRALYYCCTHSITGPCRQASGMDAQIVNGSADAARTDLVVMLKAPANAKRRLAAEIGDHAGEVAAHLLNCALEDASAWPGSTWLSPANRRDRNWLMTEMETESTLPRAFRLEPVGRASPSGPVNKKRGQFCGFVPQQGENLGERINTVDRDLRRRGVTRLIFLGTDCPGLDSAYLGRAAGSLQWADAVLGPATDGGVVLMGARRPWPALDGLNWSTESLCAELRDLCREAGWTVATLDAREDVDTLQDLLGAGIALAGDRRASRQGLAKWLRAHDSELSARQSDIACETRRGATS